MQRSRSQTRLLPVTWRARIGLAALLLLTAGLFLGASHLTSAGATTAIEIVGMVVAAAAVYLVCTTDPAYLFTLAIVLTPFAGHWPQLKIPGPASPDRLLFTAGVLVVLFRAYVLGNLPRPRTRVTHVIMAAAALFAIGSALKHGTLINKGPGLILFETFGVLPFLTFWLGPVIFPTQRERSILLVGLVIMATYLGLTALFETVNLNALVVPKYIGDPHYGLHYGRARGPFVDAVANGVGLYVGAVAAAIAAYVWKNGRARMFAALISVLCFAGTIMTLERSIWISTAAATLVGLFASRLTRRYAVPLVAAVAGIAAGIILAVPGLRAKVSDRLSGSQAKQSVYDRQNLDRTAFNMIQARPLLGFGWSRFHTDELPYIQQSPNIPLTATTADIHNTYLLYAVELGLVGSGLWLLAVVFGAGGTAVAPVPDELMPWRTGLLALFVFFAVGEAFVPPTVFVNASLWLFAGIVAVARYPAVATVPAGGIAALRRPAPDPA